MILRFAAFAAISLGILSAQTDTSARATAGAADAVAGPAAAQASPASANLLKPDESDPLVMRARDNLLQIQKLVNMGALPQLRLKKAQDDIQDALDMTILKQSLYSQDLLPEQVDQMVLVAERMVLRRERSMNEMQELVSAGVISRAEADMTASDLQRAQTELEWARARAQLVEELAESVRVRKSMASVENEAMSHPEWSSSGIVMKYEGSGLFTAADRAAMETAYSVRFSKSLPISADGETAVHRSFGFDHRGRIDVALNPDQPEGVWLRHYLETKRIPYFAFRAAVPHKATGAHIHVGPESTHLVPGE